MNLAQLTMKRGRQSNALDNSTNKAARFTPLSRFPLHFSNNKIHEQVTSSICKS